MNNEVSAVLRTSGGSLLALTGVAIKVALHDLVCETEVIQDYENNENTNIEAVYTFPLPVRAVLLDLHVTLGDKTLRGMVVERKDAEDKYEDAVTSGDTAILLQKTGDGLFTMNLGNLMAGEKARIRLRYATLLDWSGDVLRLSIPTALAPRYGEPAGLEPHQVPAHSLSAEYPLALELRVEGALAGAAIECPSHAVAAERLPGRTVLRFDEGATLDRDCVFVIRAPDATTASVASVHHDGKRCVALASIRPELPAPAEAASRSVKIVVDCSGSMAGDSIAQAKVALREILKLLRPIDEIGIVAFGSTQKALFKHQQRADQRALERARTFVDALDADMGGTELEAALEKAFELQGGLERHEILLITDGEAWNHGSVIERAIGTGHRIFAIGVGSAVAEGVVRRLSEATGGACELVSPREDMAAGIVRQFRRIYQPPVSSVHIRWPATPLWESPKAEPRVFSGDTLHLFAAFDAPIEGDAVIEMAFSGDARITQTLKLSIPEPQGTSAETAVRLAAARRIEEVEPAEALALALEHQLMSVYTCYLAVAERDDKAADLPELRVVPQMLAAGWGGVGMVASSRPGLYQQAVDLAFDELQSPPVFSRRSRPRPPATPVEFASQLKVRLGGWFTRASCPSELSEIELFRLPAEIVSTLQQLIDSGWSESLVVVSFLHEFAQRVGRRGLSRSAFRPIARAIKAASTAEPLLLYFRECMWNLSDDEWNWREPSLAPAQQDTLLSGSDMRS